MSKNTIILILKDFLINYELVQFLLDTNETLNLNKIPHSAFGNQPPPWGRFRGGRNPFTTMKNKETWKLIIQTVISILSAIATTLGLNSCL